MSGLAVVVLLVLITPERMGGASGSLLAQTSRDDYAFVTANANTLASSSGPQIAVAIVGGSSVRESYTSAEAISRAVARYTPQTAVETFNLAAHGQRLWDVLVLADALPRARDALLLIHISPSLMSASVEELAQLVSRPRVGRRSELFDTEAKRFGFKPKLRLGSHLLDNRDFYLLRFPIAIRHLITGDRPAHNMHRYLEGRYAPIGYWQRTVNLVLERWRVYPTRVEDNFAVLQRMIASLHAHGNKRFAFVESPVNPLFVSKFVDADFLRSYQQRVREFSACMNIPYWTPQDDVGLTPEVFFDWSHLNTASAQAAMTQAVARRISAELATAAQTTPSVACVARNAG